MNFIPKIRIFEFEYSIFEFEAQNSRFSKFDLKDLTLSDLNAVFTIDFVLESYIRIFELEIVFLKIRQYSILSSWVGCISLSFES